MEPYRIINFSIQLIYLIAHFFFIRALHQRRQPTPIWYWFWCLCIALWIWVSGRFLESIVYLFFPGNNSFYQFAANYQYLGNTTAAAFYLLWTLYLSGRDRLADSRAFRALIFAVPVIICTLVFTNPAHHLFYIKLDMGERVVHGPLFLPTLSGSLLTLFAGYVVSICWVMKTGRERVRQILLFSLFPLVPVFGILVRSFTGVDKLDYTPVIMAVSIYSMYQIVFRYHFVNIISASIEEVIEQTFHPIGIYEPAKGQFTYTNNIAKKKYKEAMKRFGSDLQKSGGYGGRDRSEQTFGGRQLMFEAAPLEGAEVVLITATDVSDIAREQAQIDGQIAQLETRRQELEEAARNLDAYLESRLDAQALGQKKALIDETWAMAREVFQKAEENLQIAGRASYDTAKKDLGQPVRETWDREMRDRGTRQKDLEGAGDQEKAAEEALQENLDLTRDCIAAIRRAVAQLKEEGA